MSARAAAVTQSDITRALKAAQAAGLTVFEYVTTKQGVRVITSDGARLASPANPWDEVLGDGKAK